MTEKTYCDMIKNIRILMKINLSLCKQSRQLNYTNWQNYIVVYIILFNIALLSECRLLYNLLFL